NGSYKHSRRWTLANVFKSYSGSHARDFGALIYIGLYSYPGTLFDHEIVTQISPLRVCDVSISNSRQPYHDFENAFPRLPCSPPMRGMLFGVLGIAGIGWGWWNIRNERTLPWSGISLLVGVVLWVWALSIMLP